MISSIKGIEIKAVACSLPKKQISIQDYAPELFMDKSSKRMIKSTGFSKLRLSEERVTTADYCMKAAEAIFKDFDKNEIGALVFVTQTPDYILPATSHVLQDKLNLRNDILCLDINEGCSGYITGVYTAGLLAKQLNKNVCLLVGDTVSKLFNSDDGASRCLFGDAGTATIIGPGTHDVKFAFASYGERAGSLIMENSRHRIVDDSKNLGNGYMDGLDIMNFSLNEVPVVMQSLLADENLNVEDISLFACHQANKAILISLADKLGIEYSKLPFIAGEIGNESSSSVPMVLSYSKHENLSKVMCSGFGVGLAVGAFIYDFENTKIYEVVEL